MQIANDFYENSVRFAGMSDVFPSSLLKSSNGFINLGWDPPNSLHRVSVTNHIQYYLIWYTPCDIARAIQAKKPPNPKIRKFPAKEKSLFAT
jgi:hypothetical protein